MNSKELGVKIQMAREEKNMSQEELAQAIGCSQSALSNYEKGKRHIYLEQLERLSAILNKPLDYFVDSLGGETNKAFKENDENDEYKTASIKEYNHEHNKRFIKLMNDIYELSDESFYALRDYVRFLQWKQNKEE
ncbi:MAG TPA: helix-turn-helix transcriptional regulator [Syntrophomonas sp.]|jgi:transcriptional regulator with XRE-family HTH domain|nr:helix-turn-helix transcriptional regulator [Syntrophomonas sp.]HRW13143.1 helix-turn-helix transcriptional regulator [Syntrophomonas sp.]